MTRAGWEADRKAEWCVAAGKGSATKRRQEHMDTGHTGWNKWQIRCPACGRWFSVNKLWWGQCRIPRHKSLKGPS